MSKRNVTFTKPEEPSFLKKLKTDISYVEGPSIDTKRIDLGPAEDLPETDEEKPTVVVLQEGDLTAEEAQVESARVAKEIEDVPADLEAGIVFKKPKKTTEKAPVKERKTRPPKQNKSLLSFDEEDE